MIDQPTLLGDASIPEHNGRPTIVAAAESVRDGAAAQRETVYRALYAIARWGATREELATATPRYELAAVERFAESRRVDRTLRVIK